MAFHPISASSSTQPSVTPMVLGVKTPGPLVIPTPLRVSPFNLSLHITSFRRPLKLHSANRHLGTPVHPAGCVALLSGCLGPRPDLLPLSWRVWEKNDQTQGKDQHILMHRYLSFLISQFLHLYWRSGDSKGSHPQPLAVKILIPSFFVLKTQHTLKPTVHGSQL